MHAQVYNIQEDLNILPEEDKTLKNTGRSHCKFIITNTFPLSQDSSILDLNCNRKYNLF